jgi:hypothetical protein
VRRVPGAVDLDEGAVGRERGAPPGQVRVVRASRAPARRAPGRRPPVAAARAHRRAFPLPSRACGAAPSGGSPAEPPAGALAAPAWHRSRAGWHHGPSRGTPDRPSADQDERPERDSWRSASATGLAAERVRHTRAGARSCWATRTARSRPRASRAAASASSSTRDRDRGDRPLDCL